jgi:hypothetical protein
MPDTPSLRRTSRDPDLNRLAEITLADAVNVMRLNNIARLTELVASYWWSVGLAADRAEIITIIANCREAAAATRECFATVKTLGREPDAKGAT